MTFYEEEMEAVHGKCSARIRELETELADWQRMRNEAMAVATSNRARINELEAIEKAARAVCAVTIATADHTQWFRPLAELMSAVNLPEGFAAETKGDENG